MPRLFLDTEWADVEACTLLSLALVSADGAHRFYAEVDPLPSDPTAFVRETVYPRLERGAAALSAVAFSDALRAFLHALDGEVVVVYDAGPDVDLLALAIAGFHAVGAVGETGLRVVSTAARMLACPAPRSCPASTTRWMRAEFLQSQAVMAGVERYFDERPDLARRRHHAGVDAEALRWAYLAAGQ